MTREEAIALLNEQYETCKRIYDCSADQRKSYPNVPQFMEALGIALSALRPVSREQGYDCRRTAQYCGNTGDAADVTGLPGIHVEVKRGERLNVSEAMGQAIRDARPGEIPIVAHRRNHEPWLATMRLEEWFELYREREAGREE